MSRAEELSQNRYPTMAEKYAFIDGYEQAEKDLELTNADVYDIWRIYNEVCTEGKILGFDETSQEVLKRFKDFKERKEE